MELRQVLHMSSGIGEASYANNSALQAKVISMTRSIMEEAITSLYSATRPSTLAIADLGCSLGSNTFSVISQLIGAVENLRKEMGYSDDHQQPEYQVFLNDLPGNDFNAVFRALPKILEGQEAGRRCFFAGVPGSFYGRLFPSKSLHFVHSSYSLMWLSQAPEELECNRGNIYIARTSPPSVINAYYRQYQCDFSAFLRCRARELVPGGRMVLTTLGRRGEHPSSGESCRVWELLAMALDEMVSEGLIEEENVNAFNIPQYTPSPMEVKAEVLKEGSFSVDQLEVSVVDLSRANRKTVEEGDGEIVARHMRAVAEPLLMSHFGKGILDDLFRLYRRLIDDRVREERIELINVNVTVSLTRRPAQENGWPGMQYLS